jgi:hypothetical protein
MHLYRLLGGTFASVGGIGLTAVRTVLADAMNAVALAAAAEELSDFGVSCVDRPGVEPACILATYADGPPEAARAGSG